MRLRALSGAAITLIFIVVISNQSFCQTYTVHNDGDWATNGTWLGGSAPASDGTFGTAIAWEDNKSITFTSTSPSPFLVGNIVMANSDGFTIGNGSSTVNLTLGDGSNSRSLTAGNNGTISVTDNGTLEIWGDLIVNNKLTLTVAGSGHLIIHGKLQMNNLAEITVSGSVVIDGDFDAGNNNKITVNNGGSVSVGGNVSVDNNSCLTNNGSFQVSGTCGAGTGGTNCSSQNGGSGTDFCQALPIQLISFSALVDAKRVELKWSTATEINFNHFVLEKSSNGTQFVELAQIQGSGNSNTRKDYSYTDQNPFIGNSFYRLTSIDFDGYTEVFNNNVVRVTVKAEKNFSVAPNPVQSFRLKGSVNFESTHGSVVIFDRMGSVIARYAINDSAIDVQLPMLSSGVYFAQLQSGEFSKTVRFAVNEQ